VVLEKRYHKKKKKLFAGHKSSGSAASLLYRHEHLSYQDMMFEIRPDINFDSLDDLSVSGSLDVDKL
jgi:hypothetical protein